MNMIDFLKLGSQFTFPKSRLVKNLESINKRDMRKKLISNTNVKTYINNKKINRFNIGGSLNFNTVNPITGLMLKEFYSFKNDNSRVNYGAVVPFNALKDENKKYENMFKPEYKPTVDTPIYNTLNDYITAVSLEYILDKTNPNKISKSNPKNSIKGNPLDVSINKYLGIPYVYGGDSKRGLDCSSFTRKVFNDMGYNLKGNTITLYNDTLKINLNDAKVGDLIFLKGTQSGRDKNLPSHIAIITDISLLNNGIVKVAEAPSKGKVSLNGRVWDLNKGFYKDHFLGVTRVTDKNKT